MTISRRRFIKKGAAAATGLALWKLGMQARPAQAADAPNVPITQGPFQPNWDSLAQYQCPEWFRDAKFGIWAHWTAQCVPEQGDWYARQMYIQEGNRGLQIPVRRTTVIRRRSVSRTSITCGRRRTGTPKN